MRTKLLSLILLPLTAALSCQGADPKVERNAKPKAALSESIARLKAAESFCCDDPAIYGAEEGCHGDFIRILESDDPLRSFERVLREGNPAGKIYALCGIYFCSQEAFEREISALRRAMPNGEVKVVDFDVVGKLPFADLIGESDKDAVRLIYGETLHEFIARNGKVSIDIAGGGTPLRLLDPAWIEIANHGLSPDSKRTPEEAQDFLKAKRNFYSRWLHALENSSPKASRKSSP